MGSCDSHDFPHTLKQKQKTKKKFMKKTVVAIAAVVLLASFVAEKFVVIKFKEDQVNYHWQNLNAIKQVLSQSALPHNQVVFSVQAIDSLQKDIQANVTIDSTSQTLKK